MQGGFGKWSERGRAAASMLHLQRRYNLHWARDAQRLDARHLPIPSVPQCVCVCVCCGYILRSNRACWNFIPQTLHATRITRSVGRHRKVGGGWAGQAETHSSSGVTTPKALCGCGEDRWTPSASLDGLGGWRVEVFRVALSPAPVSPVGRCGPSDAGSLMKQY